MNRNLQEKGKPQNQLFVQIYFPFFMFLVLVSTAGYFLFTNLSIGSGEHRIWADISVLIIFLPLMLIGHVLMLILILKIAFLALIRKKITRIFYIISPIIERILNTIINISDFISKPVLAVKSISSILDNSKSKKDKDLNG